MIGIDHLVLFMAAGVVLNLTPGPDVLYIVSQSLRGGARMGAVAALGITAGCFVHVAIAALGLGALLASSALAFNALKWAGAAYLAWAGLRMLLNRSGGVLMGLAPTDPAPKASWRSIFFKGFLTNVLNPKVALFFLAFVPQFIAPDATHPAWSFLLLGCLFNFNGLWVGLAWAGAAAWLADHAQAVQRRLHWLDRIAGVLFVGFGLKLALSDAPAR